jgi:hypothetical protein
MRIRNPGVKFLYFLGYVVLQIVVTSAYGIVTIVPPAIGQTVGPLLLLAAVALGVRSFRGAGEDIAAPRPWWRMSARPAAGFILGGAFTVACAVDGFGAGHSTEPALSASLQIFSVVLLATLYLHSSIQLVRAGRRARAATDDGMPLPTVAVDEPGASVQETRPLTILGITLAGALVAVILGAAVGNATVGLGPFDLEPFASSIAEGLTSGDYKVVDSSSPAYSSAAQMFRIRFPGTASVETYPGGDIDVSYRNGTSDYSIVAGTLDKAIPATKTHAYYLSIVKNLSDDDTTRTSLSATTIDGIAAEQATFTSADGLNPLNYAIVICGTHIYQLNTYGVKGSDTRKYLDSLQLEGKTTGACR